MFFFPRVPQLKSNIQRPLTTYYIFYHGNSNGETILDRRSRSYDRIVPSIECLRFRQRQSDYTIKIFRRRTNQGAQGFETNPAGRSTVCRRDNVRWKDITRNAKSFSDRTPSVIGMTIRITYYSSMPNEWNDQNDDKSAIVVRTVTNRR